MTFSPFWLASENKPYDPESYSRGWNYGAQLNFMVPLDGGTVEQCKSIARRVEEKMRVDYELVRALKCAELMQKGFTLRPGSRVEHMCNDVVPIVSVLNLKPMSTLTNQKEKELAAAKAAEAAKPTEKKAEKPIEERKKH